MDLLTRIFLEDLSLLLLLEAAVLMAVVGLHRSRQTARTRMAVWITLAGCVGLIGLQHAIESDREAIRALVQRLAEAVEAGDVPALADGLSDSVQVKDPMFGGHAGKDEVLTYTRITLQRYDINEAKVSGFNIKLTGPRAEVAFQAVCDVRGGEAGGGQRVPTRWKITCEREPDGWKVTHAEYELGIQGFGP